MALILINSTITILQAQVNVLIVQPQQPRVQVQTVRQTGTPDYASGAMIFAVIITIIIFIFQCYWGLICSITAIALAANVSSPRFILEYIYMDIGRDTDIIILFHTYIQRNNVSCQGICCYCTSAVLP